MEKRVFHYRRWETYAVAAFLTIWSVGWLIGWGSNLTSPSVSVNERPVGPAEALTITWLMLGIGVLIGVGALAMIGYALNTRIEVENDEIRDYGVRGQVKVRGSLASAAFRDEGENGAVIETDGGSISVAKGISNYGELKTIIEDKKLEPREWRSFPISSYTPSTQTFAARWGYMHLFSFAWLGFCAIFIQGAIEQGGGLVFLLAGLVFALPGVWMQFVGWFEKIRIGPEGIEFIDFLGRSRIRARLDEIVGGEWTGDSESRSVEIHTLRGTISASNNYWTKGRLVEEVEKVIEGREKDVR